MAIVYTSPGVPGGEVSPGQGSTGFTSAGVAFINSSGQLTASTAFSVLDHATSARLMIGSTATPSTVINSGALVLGGSSGPSLGVGPASLQARTSAGNAAQFTLNGSGGSVLTGGAVQVGTSGVSGKLILPSTVNISTQVGGAGAAAAVPATPEVYVKIMAPNAAGTLTTIYLAGYLSTG